jgi:hypothetical protein
MAHGYAATTLDFSRDRGSPATPRRQAARLECDLRAATGRERRSSAPVAGVTLWMLRFAGATAAVGLQVPTTIMVDLGHRLMLAPRERLGETAARLLRIASRQAPEVEVHCGPLASLVAPLLIFSRDAAQIAGDTGVGVYLRSRRT